MCFPKLKSHNQLMDLETTLQIPSFTLYPVTTEDLKTCYQSSSYKILCSLNGPYFDRKLSQLQPSFNIQITQAQFNSTSALAAEQLIRLQRKLQEVLASMVIPGKYQRMIFDITIEIIQFNAHNPSVFILSPILNLLSYTSMLKCLEVSSAFSCSAASLRNDKLIWEYQEGSPAVKGDHVLVLCNDQRDQRSLLTYFQGEYNFSNYEKLASGLQEANDELHRFQLQKVGEVYELFHQ